MAVAFDTKSQSNVSGEPASVSWTHTISSSLSNTCLLVFVNGLATTNAPTVDGNATVEISSLNPLRTFYYLNPSAGAHTVTVDGGNIKVGASLSFSGVDQSTPIGTPSTNAGGVSPQAINLTTVRNNSYRVDVLGANRDDSTVPTGTLDSGTLQNNPNTPQNQFRIDIFSYTDPIASAGSTTRTWTTSAFTRNYIAFEVLPMLSTIWNIAFV